MRELPRIIRTIPLEAGIAILGILLIAIGLALSAGIAVSMVVTGAIVLFLEFWPSIVAARKG